ncbi:MAG TPA: cupin domain-containing protein [Methylomirabilota bacterium]|nr:cupin domain-containing protein [Methylomirabilota bacterium]
MDRRAFLLGTLAGSVLAAPIAAAAQQVGIGSSEWPPGPKGLGPGVSMLVVNRHPHTLHVRYPAGHTVGPHRHISGEDVTVLSGTLLIGWGEVWDPTKFKAVRAGENVVVPPGVVHFSAVREETVMEVKILGPYSIEYILDADDPRPEKR